MNRPVTVVLVDDHPVVREGYRRLLEESGRIRIVAQVATADEAVEQCGSLRPDVVVMDIALPGVSGIEATRRILARQPDIRVLVFSMYEDVVFAQRALQAGAAGYVTKGSAPGVLVEAVEALAEGRRYLSSDISQLLALQPTRLKRSAHAALSDRELEVLRLLVQGMTLAAIADNLGLTPKTVANHQTSIKHKLGAQSPAQLLHAAARLGLGPNGPANSPA